MKRYISFSSTSNRGSQWGNIYSQIQQNTKILEAFYKSELQKIVKVCYFVCSSFNHVILDLIYFLFKDLEDNSLEENEIIEKYLSYNEDLKLKLRESKLESANYSLLHLASIYCRSTVCEYMINEIKIGSLKIDITC